MVSKGCHRREKKRRKPLNGYFEGWSREGVSRKGLPRAAAKRDSREVYHSRVSKEVSKDGLRSGASKGGASYGRVLERGSSTGFFKGRTSKGEIRRRVSMWVSEEVFEVHFEGKASKGGFVGEASKGGFGSSKRSSKSGHPKGGVQGADSAETWHYIRGAPTHRFLDGWSSSFTRKDMRSSSSTFNGGMCLWREIQTKHRI